MSDKGKYSPKDVASYYEDTTDKYLEIYGDVIQAYRPSNTDDLLAYTLHSTGIQDGHKVLDAGCGVCGPAMYFAQRRDIVVEAVTISPKQVTIAKENISKNHFEKKIDVQQGDYHELSQLYESDSFDYALFLESLGHAQDPDKVIREAHRVVKEGGYIYIKDFFTRETNDPAFKERIEQTIQNINRDYSYNVLDLHATITSLRTAGFHLDFIQKPRFENDVTIRAAFEEALDINVYAGEGEFLPAEWLEIRCQKLWW